MYKSSRTNVLLLLLTLSCFVYSTYPGNELRVFLLLYSFFVIFPVVLIVSPLLEVLGQVVLGCVVLHYHVMS